MRKPSERAVVIIPNGAGKDLSNAKNTEDAHIRIERYSKLDKIICVDRFNSSVENPSEAHIASDSFPNSDHGAEEATRFLQKHGFRVAVMIR